MHIFLINKINQNIKILGCWVSAFLNLCTLVKVSHDTMCETMKTTTKMGGG